MKRYDWWLLAMAGAIVLLTTPTPAWRVALVVIVAPVGWHLLRSLHDEWRSETRDLRDLSADHVQLRHPSTWGRHG